MARYRHYDYSQSMLIPVRLEEQLIPGTLEFAIHHLVDSRMDTSLFDGRYKNDETGRRAYDPKILLKIVLFGYSRGLISSRKLERACKENVTFMALSCGQSPDHSTIADFVCSMKEEIVPLFRDVLLVCEEEGLLGGTLFALDGCKLPSNASKRWSGRISDVARKKEKIEKKVEQLLEHQVEEDNKGDDDEEGGGSPLGQSDRSRQIERLQNRAERLEKFLQENGPKLGKQGREIRSNVTDNESAMMVGSHGVVQGYNGQALVDSKHQVIVHGEAFGNGEDEHYLVEPMLDGAKGNMQAIGKGEDYFCGKTFTADSNYHSPSNLKKCDKEHLDAYVPDKRFRNRDPRFADGRGRRRRKRKRFSLADFSYDQATDQYSCPQGKILRLNAKKVVMDGVVYRRYVSTRDECEICELKPKCLQGNNVKGRFLHVPVGSMPGHLTKVMAAKIDTNQGRRVYDQRAGIVEPVFANIRYQKSMDRFTLRGKIKVNIQWLLYCMVHNIEKVVNYGFT
jgi:transposase